jgi:hypothetical protein
MSEYGERIKQLCRMLASGQPLEREQCHELFDYIELLECALERRDNRSCGGSWREELGVE